ncbi:P-loop containing nucleoside triphosphatehydrolases superfamily protein [Striga asiatica]|uniref:P-loop containing nucleoside triphosphatehydrolases superfamily protein n=1 Tax=Striga asiatica TaxID=4170 RepID=A0A5A7Q7A0_STRAF|nr:P-loop containing nucleoside triphosphatehydrolases superfamily protein [Striga asiatica]
MGRSGRTLVSFVDWSSVSGILYSGGLSTAVLVRLYPWSGLAATVPEVNGGRGWRRLRRWMRYLTAGDGSMAELYRRECKCAAVCSMTFLQDSLQEVALNLRSASALGHVVTALTKHFRIPTQAVRIDPACSLEGTLMQCINEHELQQSDLIKNRTTAQVYTKRKAYKAYFKKLKESAAANTDQAGSSRQSSNEDKRPSSSTTT